MMLTACAQARNGKAARLPLRRAASRPSRCSPVLGWTGLESGSVPSERKLVPSRGLRWSQVLANAPVKALRVLADVLDFGLIEIWVGDDGEYRFHPGVAHGSLPQALTDPAQQSASFTKSLAPVSSSGPRARAPCRFVMSPETGATSHSVRTKEAQDSTQSGLPGGQTEGT